MRDPTEGRGLTRAKTLRFQGLTMMSGSATSKMCSVPLYTSQYWFSSGSAICRVDQSDEGRGHIPAGWTNQTRGEGIYPRGGPISPLMSNAGADELKSTHHLENNLNVHVGVWLIQHLARGHEGGGLHCCGLWIERSRVGLNKPEWLSAVDPEFSGAHRGYWDALFLGHPTAEARNHVVKSNLRGSSLPPM
eukprot:1618917-Pyramimonas_sp.AAC.1